MSEDEWDVSDSEVPAAPQKLASKWDDEDVEEDVEVKDSWDAESDDDSSSSKTKPEPVKKASLPPPKKTTLQQKLALRRQNEEEEQAKRMAEREESEAERKARLRKAEIESDLENVRALVGDLAFDDNAPPSLVTGTNLSNMHPCNRAELLEYAEMLQKKTSEFEDQAAYAVFAETVVRNIVASLNVDDTRKISSFLTTIVNEKQKQLKELQGKGKKKSSAKKTVNVARGGEFENYADDTYNEFDDFM